MNQPGLAANLLQFDINKWLGTGRAGINYVHQVWKKLEIKTGHDQNPQPAMTLSLAD
jgi:hypothetical protein